MEKTCSKCGLTKPRSEFRRTRRKLVKDGTVSWCKSCEPPHKATGTRRVGEHGFLAHDGVKRCGTCAKDRPSEDFPRHRSMPDGLSPRCRDCHRAYNQRSREERAQARCCGKCGAPLPPEKKHGHCAGCLVRKADYAKARRDTFLAAGLCTVCGKAPIAVWTLCVDDWFAQSAYNLFGARSMAPILRALWERSGGRCELTGRPLTMGDGAHVDHIVPRSRGGSDTLDNLRFVCAAANYAKRDLMDDEFFTLCREVLAHRERQHDAFAAPAMAA